MATYLTRQTSLIKIQGFSLIEIMVAMVIVAVLAAVAIPYIGNTNHKYARQEINRLVATLEMVRDLAVIENREYGLNIDEDGYQFLMLDDEEDNQPARWKVVSENKALGKHEFPEEVEVNLFIDGDNIFSAAEDEIEIFEEDVNIFEDEEEEEKIDPPQIYFLSTGEQNDFIIAVASSDLYQSRNDDPEFFRIKGTLSGTLKYQGPLPGNLFQDIDRDYSDILEDNNQ